MNKRTKVSIIGAGNVGSTTAYTLAMSGICHEVVMTDRDTDKAKGKALDISQAATIAQHNTKVTSAQNNSDLLESDIVIITAGRPRLPEMSREDLLLINAQIIQEVIQDIKPYISNSIIIVVSNPLDAMTYLTLEKLDHPKEKVIGMAGILDSTRLTYFINEKIGYGFNQIYSSVIGEHGNTMIPLSNISTVSGIPIKNILTKEEIVEVEERTRYCGSEIGGLLKTGSAFYAASQALALMVKAILNDTKQIYPCAVYLDSQNKYSDVVIGLPVVLGKNGVDKILEINLNEEQEDFFYKSFQSMKNKINILSKNNYF